MDFGREQHTVAMRGVLEYNIAMRGAHGEYNIAMREVYCGYNIAIRGHMMGTGHELRTYSILHGLEGVIGYTTLFQTYFSCDILLNESETVWTT